jgi:ribosome maturation factor RimP
MEDKIRALIEKTLNGMHLNLVRIRVFNKGSMIQIMIENQDYSPLKLDDCERVHKIIAVMLSVEFENRDFEVEISSPGIDRPLITFEDYKRFVGSEVNLLYKDEGPGNNKKISGKLIEVLPDEKIIFSILGKSENIEINYSSIISASLALNIDIGQLKKKNRV